MAEEATALTPPLLITRPEPDAAATVAACGAAGIDAMSVPLITIVPQPAALPVPGPGDAMVFTSANGVRGWLANGGARRAPAFVVGPASAEAARGAGFEVAAMGNGGADDLFPLLMKSPYRRFFHATSSHVAGRLADSLLEAGRTILTLRTYEAMAAKTLPPAMEAAMNASLAADIAFFSPRTVRIFSKAWQRAEAPAPLGQRTAFCLSAAVSDEAQALQFRHCVIATAPTLEAFVDSVRLRRT